MLQRPTQLGNADAFSVCGDGCVEVRPRAQRVTPAVSGERNAGEQIVGNGGELLAAESPGELAPGGRGIRYGEAAWSIDRARSLRQSVPDHTTTTWRLPRVECADMQQSQCAQAQGQRHPEQNGCGHSAEDVAARQQWLVCQAQSANVVGVNSDAANTVEWRIDVSPSETFAAQSVPLCVPHTERRASQVGWKRARPGHRPNRDGFAARTRKLSTAWTSERVTEAQKTQSSPLNPVGGGENCACWRS